MCQDRFDSQLLPLTHEFLAQMLGTGRPSVSLAAGVLENAGLIENMRGTVQNPKPQKPGSRSLRVLWRHPTLNGGLGLK